MSLSRSNFSTPQALADWLRRPRLPSESFTSWGVKPGTKNIHNLWLELSEGEMSLGDAYPPLRTVNVVTVRVLSKDDLVIVESRQEMSDGSVSDRFLLTVTGFTCAPTTPPCIMRSAGTGGGVVDSCLAQYLNLFKTLAEICCDYLKEFNPMVRVSVESAIPVDVG